jgi:hypothetical protein
VLVSLQVCLPVVWEAEEAAVATVEEEVVEGGARQVAISSLVGEALDALSSSVPSSSSVHAKVCSLMW